MEEEQPVDERCSSESDSPSWFKKKLSSSWTITWAANNEWKNGYVIIKETILKQDNADGFQRCHFESGGKVHVWGFLKRLSACMWLRMECYEVECNEKDTESSEGKQNEMKVQRGKKWHCLIFERATNTFSLSVRKCLNSIFHLSSAVTWKMSYWSWNNSTC